MHVKGLGVEVETSLPQLNRKLFMEVIVTDDGMVNFNYVFAGMSPNGSIVNVYLLGSKTFPEVDSTLKF